MQEPDIIIPTVSQTSLDDYKVLKSKNFELKTKDSLEFEGLGLLLTSVIFEDIAECPGNPSMPAGSGVVVYFTVSKGNQSEEVFLNELSAPYGSKSSLVWDTYKITLTEVTGYNSPTTIISINLLDK